ncbi:transporter substrate-binding domain-containing protein [Pseudomonas segetis]|uniref:histidine kinase n=1 Tax=Pseudomonas segetis TaxID=298908 RepID=A0A239CNY2_9PSED|nr:transporter substrate-binding domain-containing protein [Pseudomonas segetis]SNS21850.1 multi-sensor hybrid histidine kinase [Pseudomonas segetis]
MANFLRITCVFLLSLCALSDAHAAETTGEFTRLELLGLSQPVLHRTQLSEDDWNWLRKKETLVLGTYGTDYPPFRLGADSNEFSGVTADILALISRELGIKVEAHLYKSRQAAVEALQNGELDMLSSLGPIESAPDLLKTKRYVNLTPALVQGTEKGWQATEKNLSGSKIAYNYLDISRSQAQALAPGAILTPFSSDLESFSSVAFGSQDAVLSNVVSANYLVNTFYANELKVIHAFWGEPPDGARFVLRSDNQRLLNILNNVIRNGISPEQRKLIIKRWNGGGLSNIKMPELTRLQKRWVATHPTLRVGVAENFPPYSYIGNDDHYYGITSDLLTLIQTQTDLEIEIIRFAKLDDMIEALINGKVDMLADISPSDQRRDWMTFSRSYLPTPYALVSPVSQQRILSLDKTSNKRIAIADEHALIPFLREQYPNLKLVEATDTPDAFAMVAAGEADFTIQPLFVARYYLARFYQKQLHISMTLTKPLSAASFALRRGDRQLQEIINSALVEISPDEYGALINRWRSRVVLSPPSWRNYKPLIYQAITAAVIVLMIFLGWNFYLRNQIRKRKAAERELSEQIQFMELLINGTPHPIYVRDLDMSVRICNDSYLQALGASREDVIGHADLRHFSPEDAQAIMRDHHQVITEREPVIVDRKITLNGEPRVIYHWKLPYVDRKGVVRGIIGGWVDISDRRALIEQLRAAKDQADKANRTKTTFLATMSHEIRTPLNAVIGMLELALKRETNAPADHASLEVAYNSARGLLELIGDILDVAHIESGHLSIHPERADLRQIAEGVVRVFEGLARQKSLELRLELEGALDEQVLLDPLRFRQVLSNLVSNAIKFTARGHVLLKLVGTALDDDYLQLRVEVSDTGIGISPKNQKTLFQPFVQVHETSGGSGLGLMICRNLVEMMGGSLELESQEGMGTCVSVSLKLLCLEPVQSSVTLSPPEHAPRQALPKLKILVVDDHPANRMLLAQQMEFLGQQVECAVDGENAFALWQSQHFDLVITDCNMPVMNGYTLSRTIRSKEQMQGATPCTILGFTANAQPEMLQLCIDAGMNGCLFKPVELDDLVNALTEVTPTEPVAREVPFDQEALERISGGNKAVSIRLLDQIKITVAEDLSKLEHLLESADLNALSELAHRIKGAAAIIRANELINSCVAVEQACNDGDTLQAQEQAQRMASALRALEQAIEQTNLGHEAT